MERNATRAHMWRQATLKPRVLCALVLLLESAIHSQTPQKLSVPADSPRWELQGQAKVTEYQGRKCRFLNGGAAVVKDFEMRGGVIDFDMVAPDAATSNRRGFAGLLSDWIKMAPTVKSSIYVSTSPVFLMLCSIRRSSIRAAT